MATLNAPEEIELAELLLELHPWADSVRYPITGGEAMTIPNQTKKLIEIAAESEADAVKFQTYSA